jgi:hypothetical protein
VVRHRIVDLWLGVVVVEQAPARAPARRTGMRVECRCGWASAGDLELVIGRLWAHGLPPEELRRALEDLARPGGAG